MLNELQWNNILRHIESEKCVLILGTDCLVDAQNKPLLPQFLTSVGYPDSPQIRFFDGDFLFYKDEISKRLISGEWQDFLKKQSPPPFLSELAQIPFHVCLSLTPDLRLRKAFEAQEFDYAFDFYQKNKKPLDLAEKPSKNKPLIYNLMGKIDASDSLVFTQEDTFDYLISILGDYRLANLLEKELISAENILFLSLPLQKWYMKMLMKLLKVNFGMALSNEKELDKNTQFFCENRNITLVQADIVQFVSLLRQKCQDKGIALRQKPTQNAENELDTIAKLIKEDVGTCLEQLVDYLEGKDDDLYNSAMIQSAAYAKLQREMAKGKIDSRDAGVAEAKILDAILQIIKEGKQL
jgi:Effector-associated domain 11/SIR2-like domain